MNSAIESSILDNWIAHELNQHRMSGGALEVMRGTETIYQRFFGFKDPEEKESTTPDTIFWLASMTKPVVGVAALSLLEEGQLDLEAPVSQYAADLKISHILAENENRAELSCQPTILDLFRHTAGLTYGHLDLDPIHKAYQEASVYNYEITNAEMAKRLCDLPLLHKPGSYFEYGMSSDLLGYIIEVITGKQLEYAVYERVLQPLGMIDTTFHPDPGKVFQPPCYIEKSTLTPNLSPSEQWASGGAGLWGTIEDYKKFALMLKNGGSLNGRTILKTDTVNLMLKNHLPEGVRFGAGTEGLGITAPTPEQGLGFGLGIAIRQRNCSAPPGYQGEFFWPGISGTNFWVDPENNLSVIFMTYAPEHRGRHRSDLRTAIYSAIKF